MVTPAGDVVMASRRIPRSPLVAAFTLTEATSKAGAGAAGWPNAPHTPNARKPAAKLARIFSLRLLK